MKSFWGIFGSADPAEKRQNQIDIHNAIQSPDKIIKQSNGGIIITGTKTKADNPYTLKKH